MIQEATDKIKLNKERIKIAQRRQKSYIDEHRRSLEFEVGTKFS